MEQKIKQQISGNNNIQVGGDYITTKKVVRRNEVVPNYEIHISDEQAMMIKEKIIKIATESAIKETDKPPSFQKLYIKIYKKFKVSSYKLIPKEKFEDVIVFINQMNRIDFAKKTRIANNDEYRKGLYKAIHAKAHQLGMNNDELYEFINKTLQLKTTVISIKDISDTLLKKVYNKIIAKSPKKSK